jgi:hypothetical protein
MAASASGGLGASNSREPWTSSSEEASYADAMTPLLQRRNEQHLRVDCIASSDFMKNKAQNDAEAGEPLRKNVPGADVESGGSKDAGLWRIFGLARPERTMIIIGTIALLVSAVANIALVSDYKQHPIPGGLELLDKL